MCDSNIGQYIWLSSNEDDLYIRLYDEKINEDEENIEILLPVQTLLVHRVKVIGDRNAYLFCYSFNQLSFSPKKIDFVATICDAAFLSTSASQSFTAINEDLDSKDFFFLDGPDIDSPRIPLKKLTLSSEEIMEILLKATPNLLPQEEPTPILIKPKKDLNRRTSLAIPQNSSWSYTNKTMVSPYKPSNTNQSQVFPLDELPILQEAPDDILIESLTDLKHLAFGLHSALMSARYNGTKVFVKFMIPELVSSSLAQREFEFEQKLLRRLDHPNIVRIIGSGSVPHPNGPRRFTVLEWLDEALTDMISTSKGTDKLLRKLMPNHKSIPFTTVISIACDVANALEYLHNGVSPDASIIHCQIEPDNIRFDSHGNVKLIGFRSSTCMRRRDLHSTRGYPVLEHTGTLRYTPPEVALRLSYSEKSDVYQFGIVLWQIARDKVPFVGLTKTEYLNRVVYGNERPKVDKTWPPEFIFLLQSCCHSEQFRRPTMASVEQSLLEILSHSPGKSAKKRLSWKLANHGEDNNQSEHNGNTVATKVSGRRSIVESDRKSAWF